jgi:hypothetical protein
MSEEKAPNSSDALSGITDTNLAADTRPSSSQRARQATLSLSGWMRDVWDQLEDDQLPRS